MSKEPPQMSIPASEDPKEKFLRVEINNLADRMHRLFQWGLTLLLSLETALFFVRKEAAERAGLPPGSPFPIVRHLWGFSVILFLAVVFVCLHHGLGKLYKQYFVQLYPAISPTKKSPSPCGIVSPNVKWKTQWVLDLVMLAFPIFDLSIGLVNYYSPLHASGGSSVVTITQVQGSPLSITITGGQLQVSPITPQVAPLQPPVLPSPTSSPAKSNP